MATEGIKRFRLHVDMQCRCTGCIRKVEKAMASIGTLSGIEMSVGDVDTGIVKVVGKVNPTEVCDWLKRKTRKNVEVVCPDSPVDNVKQKIIVVMGSGSRSKYAAAPSAPPLQDEMPRRAPDQSCHEIMQLIEEKIRELERTRDALKIKNLENELVSIKHDLEQSRKLTEGSKKVLLDSALNQFKAYENLQALGESPWYRAYY